MHRFLLLKLLRLWQLIISPLYGMPCRFHPHCSDYAKESVQKHGAVKGSWLTIKRLMRCNPWGGSGVDEVP